MRYLVHDVENNEHRIFETLAEAQKYAYELLLDYRLEASGYGWPDRNDFISIFELHLHSQTHRTKTKKRSDCEDLLDSEGFCAECETDWSLFDVICDYEIAAVTKEKEC